MVASRSSSKTGDDLEAPLPGSVSETALSPSPEEAPPVVSLERGAVLSLSATVLRQVGPYIQLSIAGELFTLLRSRLEKELDYGR